MTAHSQLPPSSAARRRACPGSRELESKFPEDKESQYAIEGNLAHWVASTALRNHFRISAPDSYVSDFGLITQEMTEGAEIYKDFIISTCKSADKSKLTISIEERVDISIIHPDCWGTPDCWTYFLNAETNRMELHVYDYKFGHGFVEAVENWQLIEYTAGILNKLGVNGIDDRKLRVSLHIIQPRSYHPSGHIRTWNILASELRPYFNRLHTSEHVAMEPNAPCNPNPECSFCTGRHACEALQRAALSAVDRSTLNVPHELSPEALGNELRHLKRAADLIEARITGLTEYALGLIRRGNRVSHFRVESAPGRLHWKFPTENIIALGDLMGIDIKKPADVITPNQAIKAGMDETLINSFSERRTGALKLVSDDTKETRRIFGEK